MNVQSFLYVLNDESTHRQGNGVIIGEASDVTGNN